MEDHQKKEDKGHAHHAKSSTTKSVFEVLTPAQTFIGGAVAGVLILCTIGFVILLSMYLKGAFPDGTTAAAGKAAPTVQAPTPNQPGQPAQGLSVRPIDKEKDHIRGNKDAKITIVEYSDFECPFCKRFHDTMKQIIDNYGEDVRWVYRQFPLDQLHRKARPEAIATECAAEQGKFWELADLIFEETRGNDTLDLDRLPEYAGSLGMNVGQFTECISSDKYAKDVQEDEQDAQAAGGRGTPYSVLITPDGEIIPISGAQPYAVVEQTIQNYL